MAKQELPKRKEGEDALEYLKRVRDYWADKEKWDKVEQVAKQMVTETRTRKKDEKPEKKEEPKKEKPKEELIEFQRPVRKEGESLASYLARLKEWRDKVKK